MRTTSPSETKSFLGSNFCRRCYDALNLTSLEKKEVEGYLLSIATDNNKQLLEALVTIASRFQRDEREPFLLQAVRVIGEEAPDPANVLALLIAAKAVQDSTGSEPLTKAGELALANIAGRISHDLIRRSHEPLLLDNNLSGHELYEKGKEILKHNFDSCAEILNEIEPSEYTEIIREGIIEEKNTLDSLVDEEEVDLLTVGEGFYLDCHEQLTDYLEEELGTEKVFHSWNELKETLETMEGTFKDNGIYLSVAEEDYDSDIHLLVDVGELCLITGWETIKKEVASGDMDVFIPLLEKLPIFVLEKAVKDKEALKTLSEKALSEEPENVELILKHSQLLQEMDKTGEAITFLKEKIEIIPETDLFMELVDLMIFEGKPEEAIKTLENLERAVPENAAIPMMMGELYETMREFRKAKESYERALKKDQKKAYLMSRIRKTEITAAVADIEESISQEDYEKALEILDVYYDPFDISVFHYYKGLLLARTGSPREALNVMTGYLDIFPDDKDGWLEKATTYLNIGQVAAAARCFRRCSLLDPSDIKPLVWEALCHKKLGRSRTYKRCINQARKIDPEGTKALLKQYRF